jgi:hypothetical protein
LKMLPLWIDGPFPFGCAQQSKEAG